jgi:hypothetical protein
MAIIASILRSLLWGLGIWLARGGHKKEAVIKKAAVTSGLSVLNKSGPVA